MACLRAAWFCPPPPPEGEPLLPLSGEAALALRVAREMAWSERALADTHHLFVALSGSGEWPFNNRSAREYVEEAENRRRRRPSLLHRWLAGPAAPWRWRPSEVQDGTRAEPGPGLPDAPDLAAALGRARDAALLEGRGEVLTEDLRLALFTGPSVVLVYTTRPTAVWKRGEAPIGPAARVPSWWTHQMLTRLPQTHPRALAMSRAEAQALGWLREAGEKEKGSAE